MTRELFFDTDCISAFLWIKDTNILQALYGGYIVLPEPVFQELSNPRVPHLRKRVEDLIEKKVASLKYIEPGTKEYHLYRELQKGKKAIGKGEASGIALAVIYDGILASNNYKDVAPFIKMYNLKHVDTGMILKEAYEKNIITEKEGNDIWCKMLQRNRKLPSATFSDYLHNL